jgi:hypothetical protein
VAADGEPDVSRGEADGTSDHDPDGVRAVAVAPGGKADDGGGQVVEDVEDQGALSRPLPGLAQGNRVLPRRSQMSTSTRSCHQKNPNHVPSSSGWRGTGDFPDAKRDPTPCAVLVQLSGTQRKVVVPFKCYENLPGQRSRHHA